MRRVLYSAVVTNSTWCNAMPLEHPSTRL